MINPAEITSEGEAGTGGFYSPAEERQQLLFSVSAFNHLNISALLYMMPFIYLFNSLFIYLDVLIIRHKADCNFI